MKRALVKSGYMETQKQQQSKKKLEAAVVMGKRGGAALYRKIGSEGYSRMGKAGVVARRKKKAGRGERNNHD
jgi:hypothetical protein